MPNPLSALPRVQFLQVPLVSVTTDGFIDALIAAAKAHVTKPIFITYLNAWCTVVAQKNAGYRTLLQKADAVYADGQAIVWASRVLSKPVPERVNAADFIVQFCEQAAAGSLTIYLLGSAPGVAKAAAEEWQRQVPALKVVGTHDGYFADGGEALIQQINDARPDVLLLGLGVPLQEQWAAANLHRLHTKVVWCIGAMFEYHGKARARAPLWVRRAGLEWLFRLLLEPRRLARRYLFGTSSFSTTSHVRS